MKKTSVALLRRLLDRIGLEFYHGTSDPILRSLMTARETLRVSPNLPAWQVDELLSQITSQAHARNLLRTCAIDLVIDIGANYGQFAQSLRHSGYNGQIISFEPLVAAYAALKTAAVHDPAWQIHRFAVGDAPAELPFNVYCNSVFSSLHTASSTGQDRFGSHLVIDHVETVPVRTLDSLAAEFFPTAPNARILLKTDTQGHDLAVLRGAPLTLQRTTAIATEASVRPIYEGSPTYQEIIQFLACAGFRLSGLYPISHDDRDFSLIELDCYFVRANAAPAL